MKNYIVLFHDVSHENGIVPEVFACLAGDSDHAEDQCLNAYPEGTVTWIEQTNCIECAYHRYYEA